MAKAVRLISWAATIALTGALSALGGAVQAADSPQGGGAAGAAGAPAAPGALPHFSAEQVQAGKAAYAQNCAMCHGSTLDNGQFAPALRGQTFMGHWAGRSVAALFNYTEQRMPPSGPNSLGDAVYAQVLAYVLQ